jgi:molecular chaperone DnaK
MPKVIGIDLGTTDSAMATLEAGQPTVLELSEEEIKRLVREAEEHAAGDAHRREEVEVRNWADTLAYAAEKLLRESGDQLRNDLKVELDDQAQTVRPALNQADIGPSADRRGRSRIASPACARSHSGVPPSAQPPARKVNAAREGDASEMVEGEFREV